MNQTRLGSLIESVLNTGIGLGINLVAQRLVFPLFGFTPDFGTNLSIAAIFTVISVVRGYCVRRYLEARLRRMAHHLAEGIVR